MPPRRAGPGARGRWQRREAAGACEAGPAAEVEGDSAACGEGPERRRRGTSAPRGGGVGLGGEGLRGRRGHCEEDGDGEGSLGPTEKAVRCLCPSEGQWVCQEKGLR